MPPPTCQYRLLPEGLPAAQQRVRSRYLMPQLLVVLLFVLLSVFFGALHDRGHSSALRFVIPFGLFFTYVVFAAPRRVRRSLAQSWSSYLLEIGPDYLLRTQSTAPDLRLAFSEIGSIQRLPGRHLRVYGSSAQRILLIPESIERFPEILATLAALQPITETRSDRSVKSTFLVAIIMGGFLLMLWTPNPTLVIAAAILVLATVLYAFAHTIRNPNATHRARREAWLYLLPAALCLWKLLSALGVLHH